MLNSIVSSPTPTWSSHLCQERIVSFDLNGKMASCPEDTEVEFLEWWAPRRAKVSDIDFRDFAKGTMKVCMDSSGAIKSILLWEKTPRWKVASYHSSNELESPARIQGQSTQKTPDALRESIDAILAYVNKPSIIDIPPDHSLWHVYREGTPSSEIHGYFLRDSGIYWAQELRKKSQEDILLGILGKKDQQGCSCHPDVISSVREIIDAFSDGDGNISEERMFSEVLNSVPVPTGLLVFQFLTEVYYQDRRKNVPEFVSSVRSRLLSAYALEDNRIPYAEIREAIEKWIDGQASVLQLVRIFRDIPPKDRVAFLSLLSAEPIIEIFRSALKQRLHFSHSVFTSAESIPDKHIGEALLKHIHKLELSDGCSVGCAFCSLEPARKKPKELGHFPVSDVLLLAASYGEDFNPILYSASDPLDWEGQVWEEALHYFDLQGFMVVLTGKAPYVSTAVPKNKVSLAEEHAPMIDRISLSYWNHPRLRNHQFSGLWEGLLWANREILPHTRKYIQWSGISKERANKHYEPLNVNAWFPSCSSGVKVSPVGINVMNHITVWSRNAAIAPQGYFEIAIDTMSPKYLSKPITYWTDKWDLSILQNLMTGSMALPMHADHPIQRKTPQIFWAGSFFLRVLWFDGQERKYVFIYSHGNTGKSAILYLTPKMYEELYFTGIPSERETIDPSWPKKLAEPERDYTAQEVFDLVFSGKDLAGVIRYLLVLKNFENCHFSVEETKILILRLLELHGGREDDHGFVIERLIRHAMFHEMPCDPGEMVDFFSSLLSRSVLNRAIVVQLEAAVENFKSRRPVEPDRAFS